MDNNSEKAKSESLLSCLLPPCGSFLYLALLMLPACWGRINDLSLMLPDLLTATHSSTYNLCLHSCPDGSNPSCNVGLCRCVLLVFPQTRREQDSHQVVVTVSEVRFYNKNAWALTSDVAQINHWTLCLSVLRSPVILQASVQGCKAGVTPLALSDHSDSRKRTRPSLPANGVGGRSVAAFYAWHTAIWCEGAVKELEGAVVLACP